MRKLKMKFIMLKSASDTRRKLLKLLIWTQVFFWSVSLFNIEQNPSQISSPSPSSVSSRDDYKFQNFNLSEWDTHQRIVLTDDTRSYFVSVGNASCYKKGTNLERSIADCVCLRGYYGRHCGIPRSAWESHFRHHPSDEAKLTPRSIPRRVIHGIQVNHEFDLLEARLHMLDGLVDAYLLLESNYSAYGSPKPLRFLERFKDGWMSEFQDKILYVFLSYFPKAGETNGWYADSYLRVFLGKSGLNLLERTRDDDIFLLLDADELPTPESILFLKLFDGWSEPVKFAFRWSVFGFFWLKAEDPGVLETLPLIGKLIQRERKEKVLYLYVACTLGMLSAVYDNNAVLLRKNVWTHTMLRGKVNNYTKTHQKIKSWTLGTSPHYAGHHCSWCYTPQDIQLKMSSAQRHDKPRWGDYPEKLDLFYIQGLVESGSWFDDTKPFIFVDREETEPDIYAPEYILQHDERYHYLLDLPNPSLDNQP